MTERDHKAQQEALQAAITKGLQRILGDVLKDARFEQWSMAVFVPT